MKPSSTTARATTVKKQPRRLSRSELNEQAWQRKKQKKRRGNPPGSRSNPGLAKAKPPVVVSARDPRIGSKKAVPLTRGGDQHNEELSVTTQALSPEQELAWLENHPQLDALLDKLEAGETLDDKDELWLKEKLTRIEQLMQQLDIIADQNTEPAQAKENMMSLLKNTR